MDRRFVAAITIAAALTGCSSAISGHGIAVSSSAKVETSAPSSAGQTGLTFHGVTVVGAADLSAAPQVSSRPTQPVTQLLYADLVAGTGPAATPDSTVTVQYVGVLYADGTKFDSSWDRGHPEQFSLHQVVTGFAAAIGGTSSVPAMRVGGRRLMILPPDLAYGSQPQGSIPADSTLVFVVDLTGVS